MEKDEETEELIKIFVTSIKTAEKKQKQKTYGIKLRSEATSLFDVQRSMFDVGRSSFKPLIFRC